MEHGGDFSAQERGENAAAQEEELEALEAIYGEDCEVLSRGSTASCPELRIRVSEIPLVSLHLHLPVGYPSRELPVVEIRAPGLGQAARNKLVKALNPEGRGQSDPNAEEGHPTDSFPAGTVVIFDWAETLRDSLSRTDYSDHPATADTTSTAQDEELSYSSSSLTAATAAHEAAATATALAAVAAVTDASAAAGAGAAGGGSGGGSGGGVSEAWKPDGTAMGKGGEGGAGARRAPPAGVGRGGRGLEEEVLAEEFVEIFHGEAFTDRKSTFQAHLARVYSERQVDWVRHRLLENSKIARATHNVAAWRVWDEARGVQLHDNDDDGESAAGSRLAHMLAITRAQNVLVVVSRWFGGIHLGPDRFKHINNAARELLVKCGGTIPSDNGGASDKKNTDREGGGKQKGRRKRG